MLCGKEFLTDLFKSTLRKLHYEDIYEDIAKGNEPFASIDKSEIQGLLDYATRISLETNTILF